MSLLQFIIIISAIIFLLFGLDLYKRKKMNILHFIVFFLGGGLVIVFALNNQLLNRFGMFFGLARGADVLVYTSLILLFYFYIDLLNKHTKDKFNLTRLISATTINETYSKYSEKIKKYKNSDFKDNFIFNIRTYNESTLCDVIEEIIEEGFHKILIINDGSTDNTIELVNSTQKKHPDRLILLASHTINRGGGAANQTGYNFIKKYGEELQIKRFVGFDADGQMDIKDTKTFIKRIKENQDNQKKIDLYLGSRFIAGSKHENMPSSRKIILKISKIVTRIFYGTKVSDPHSGFRIISLESLRKINITSDGMHYANEVNEQIKSHKMKFEEVPVHTKYTEYSLNKGQKNSNSIKLAFEMIYKKIFFR